MRGLLKGGWPSTGAQVISDVAETMSVRARDGEFGDLLEKFCLVAEA